MSAAPQRARAAADPGASTEADLVAGARAGDEAAMRELIRRLNPRLFRVARGHLDGDAEAEEAVQEAWIAAFTRLEQFRGEAAFSTWVTRIAINAARMRRRAARPQEEYDTVAERARPDVLAFPGRGTESAEAALARREVRGMLEAAVSALPPELRVVFLLREAEGLAVAAIARDLSLNAITVRTRLFRARRLLRTTLEARLQGGFAAVFPFDGARCAGMADRVVAGLRAGGRL
ncbi:RNA polymerase sigma factor [Paracoccus sp. S-4012]|uniref:RNA polymerase sigma factor n=1 Tax=Paracoccus sp. S-4012 TaxID=2665648 RepID=UPI0012AEEDD0|nr:RNA polymerase sigma factor [Paracoccus sp. S-4012]MRX50008.1 RNA polymerase sigma factor [Paracoccus sp. S-4012]